MTDEVLEPLDELQEPQVPPPLLFERETEVFQEGLVDGRGPFPECMVPDVPAVPLLSTL